MWLDLGGQIGGSYICIRKYSDYPAGRSWAIHDRPSVMAADRRWAQGHEAESQLSFTDSVEHADGQDILLSTGALQYVDYTLPELLQRLRRKPRHVLVNLTPMHTDRSFFTLQNLRLALRSEDHTS